MTDAKSLSTQPKLISVSKLAKSPLNARRTVAKIGMEELKASLLAHGLMQNLVVTDSGDGAYLVIAGGRRLEAIQALQAEGKLPEDFDVPCQIVTEQQALEMSLAENTVRQAMHPADQFEAFAALIEQGASAAETASHFGVEESLVLKRMKLARVAPQLLAEYRNDEITLECLMAYTVTDDHRRQLKVFKSLRQWEKDQPSSIRSALTEKFVEAQDKLARFVGIEAYESAGGITRADMFGEEVYLENASLLHKLAGEKLDRVRKELESAGWGWIEVTPERDYDTIHRCGRLQPRLIDAPAELIEQKSQLDAELAALEESDTDEGEELSESLHDKLDEIERKLAGFVDFDETQKQLAGCFVSIASDGGLQLDKGLVKPEHRKALAKLLGEDEASVKSAKPKPKDGLPESLRRDLANERLPIAQLAIASHPDVALDLLMFTLATKLLDERHHTFRLDISCQRSYRSKDHRERLEAARQLKALEKALSLGWSKTESEAKRFEAFRALPQEHKQAILAYCIAETLKPSLGSSTADDATAIDMALSLTQVSVADYWRPTKENFLSRRTREQLLTLSRELFGLDRAQYHLNDKKAALVDQLDRVFSNPEKSGRTPEQIETLKHWLPAGMGFGTVASSKLAKSRARKTASAA